MNDTSQQLLLWSHYVSLFYNGMKFHPQFILSHILIYENIVAE